MIGRSRPYTQREFNQKECLRNEINNSCEFIPSSNLILYENRLHEIPLYIDSGKKIWNWIFFIHFVCLARIAFNSDGAVFFNLRYFEQVFADDLRSHSSNDSSSNVIIRRTVNFYFVVTCHELSHNIDSNQDLNLRCCCAFRYTIRDLILHLC